MRLTVLIDIVALGLCLVVFSRAGDVSHYIAAVYEHNFKISLICSLFTCGRKGALQHMHENLDVYEEQVAEAAKQGAQIIVFPEDGIHGFRFTRHSITGYLETIPDPKEVSWSPCLEPERFPNTEILHRLSCMAQRNSIYLVANMPDRQDCAGADPQCPTDGRRHYNTDVVFSDNGTLVARYHKQNLYKEKEFDVPPEIEYVTFNTPFAGKFAIFTCFDILFREPAITLLEKHQVKQVVFPTAWINKLPLLSAVQFQQAFATAWGINLLAANIHLPRFKMTGSGIFTPTNSTFHYDIETSKGRLLVSKVPVPPPVQDDPSTASQSPQSPLTQNPECSRISTAILEPPAVFHANMMNDNFTFTLLTGKKGELSVCNGHLCCYLTYQQSNTNGELYAIGAFNGLHKGHRQSFLEVCALVRCAGDSQDTCGADISQASTTFDFCLQGNFSTPYVYPSILASGVDLVIPDGVGWTSGSFLMSKEGMSKGLVTAALYGRVYDKDKV